MKIILFSPQFIDIVIVNNFEPEKHILIEKKTNQICSVIKQAQKVREVFQVFRQLLQKKKSQVKKQQKIVIVSYSSKQKSQLYKIYAAVCKQLADKIIYISIDKNKFPNFKANRAILYTPNEIGYGQGFSQTSVKDELRLVIQCALNQFNQNSFIIFEKNQQQIKALKKQGFINIIQTLNKQLLLKFIEETELFDRAIIEMDGKKMQFFQQNIENKFLNKEKLQFCQEYLKLVSQNIKISKLTQQKQAKVEVKIAPHDLVQILTQRSLQNFLTTPKNYLQIIPKTSVRNLHSKQISSFIFRNIDNKLYIAKSQKTRQIGGDYYEESIQNRQFISLLGHLLCSNVFSLIHQKISTLMKASLIKSYQTKKGVFTVKPYLQNIQTLQNFINFQSQDSKQHQTMTIAQQIFYKGTILGKEVKGFGQILLMSFVCNQNLKVKSLFQQISLIKIQGQNSLQYLKKKDKLTQFIGQKKTLYKFLRTEYFQPLKNINFKISNQNFRLSFKLPQFCLQKLHQSYLNQIKNILDQILSLQPQKNQNQKSQFKSQIDFMQQQHSQEKLKLRMVKSFFAHYKWQFDKKDLFQIFVYRCQLLKNLLAQIIAKKNKQDSLHNNWQVQNIIINQKVLKHVENHPYLFLLLHTQNFYKFLRTNEDQQMFFSDHHTNKQNLYNVLVHKPQSFQIVSPFTPVQTFLRWIKSTQKYPFIDYMSMMDKNKQDYLLISKKMGIASKNAKKQAILLVDHCQLCPQIYDQQLSIKTVFISRLKKGSLTQMSQIYQQECVQKFLTDNQQQSLQLLFQLSKFNSNSQKGFMFQKYKWVLQNFIKIKCKTLKCEQSAIWQFLFILHKCITTNKNRAQQLKQKFPQKNQNTNERNRINWKLVHCLPVYRKNQKIFFANNLYSFIYVLKLFEQLQSGQWKCKIQSNQYQALKEWSDLIDPKSKQILIKNILLYLQKKTSLNLNTLQIEDLIEERNDILQILMILTKTQKQKYQKVALQISNEKQPHIKNQSVSSFIYNDFFMEHVTTYNFKKILQVFQTSKFLISGQPLIIVHSSEGITFYSVNPLKNEKIYKLACKLFVVNIEQTETFIEINGYGVTELQNSQIKFYPKNIIISQQTLLTATQPIQKIQESFRNDRCKEKLIDQTLSKKLLYYQSESSSNYLQNSYISLSLSHKKQSDALAIILQKKQFQITFIKQQNSNKQHFCEKFSFKKSQDEQIKQVKSIDISTFQTNKTEFHNFVVLTNKKIFLISAFISNQGRVDKTIQMIYEAKQQFNLNSFQILLSKNEVNNHIMIISQNNSLFPLSEICVGVLRLNEKNQLHFDIISKVYQKQYIQCAGFNQKDQVLYWFNKKDDTMRSIKINHKKKQFIMHQEKILQQYQQKFLIQQNAKQINTFQNSVFVLSHDNYLKKMRKIRIASNQTQTD